MLSNDNFNPNKIFYPGVTLQETLDSFGMSQVDLALRTDLTPKTINEIIQGKNPITPETAIKLANVFGTSANFWNNLQRNYEADTIRLEIDKNITNDTHNLKRFSICYSELVKNACIEHTTNKKEKVKNLLNFFGVSSLDLITNVQAAVFRQSKNKSVNKESLAGWLRCGEIKAQKIETSNFNKELLQEKIPQLKSLTREENPAKLQKELENICSSFGVALILVPYFKNTHVNGAAWWLNQNKPIIQLSLKGHYIDSFWFTFFHEIGHLLKHGKKEQYIDYKGVERENENLKIEEEANKYANDTLIPDRQYNNFIQNKNYSRAAINKFAQEIGVSPAIVAGKICYENKDKKQVWKRFSPLRTRYLLSN